MQITLDILKAMILCPYKAWLYTHDANPDIQNIDLPYVQSKVVQATLELNSNTIIPEKLLRPKSARKLKQAKILLSETIEIIKQEKPPVLGAGFTNDLNGAFMFGVSYIYGRSTRFGISGGFAMTSYRTPTSY